MANAFLRIKCAQAKSKVVLALIINIIPLLFLNEALSGEDSDNVSIRSLSTGGERVLFWESKTKEGGRLLKNDKITPIGASRYGKFHELDPGNGKFIFEIKTENSERLDNEWFLEMVILPSETNGNIIQFNGVKVFQRANKIIASDSTIENSIQTNTLTVNESVHLLIKCHRSIISIFQNGKLIDQENSKNWNFALAKSKPKKVVIGGGWEGKVYKVSIEASVRNFEAALDRGISAIGFKVLSSNLMKLKGSLVEVTALPKIKQIAPYRRAMIYNCYELDNLSRKMTGSSHIAVAHWSILDNQYVLGVPEKIGSNYELLVEPYSDNPQIKRERQFNDLSRFDLKLFYDVRMPKIDESLSD